MYCGRDNGASRFCGRYGCARARLQWGCVHQGAAEVAHGAPERESDEGAARSPLLEVAVWAPVSAVANRRSAAVVVA
jgi:hypothetical protein